MLNSIEKTLTFVIILNVIGYVFNTSIEFQRIVSTDVGYSIFLISIITLILLYRYWKWAVENNSPKKEKLKK